MTTTTITTAELSKVIEVMGQMVDHPDVSRLVRSSYVRYAGAKPVVAITGNEAREAFEEAVGVLDSAQVLAAISDGVETDSMGMNQLYVYTRLTVSD